MKMTEQKFSTENGVNDGSIVQEVNLQLKELQSYAEYLLTFWGKTGSIKYLQGDRTR
jgi:predicted transcriptional regulator